MRYVSPNSNCSLTSDLTFQACCYRSSPTCCQSLSYKFEEAITLKANYPFNKCFLISKANDIIIFSCIDNHRSGGMMIPDSDEMNQHGARKKPAGAHGKT